MIHSQADMAVVVVLILFGLSPFTVRSEDIPEFQYPCYVDICTFPTQFCNSDRFERRCSPCTRAICRESKVPLACKYICKKYETPLTTTTLSPTKFAKSSHKDSSKNDYCTPSFLLLGYSAISTTIIVILLAAILVCVLRRQTKLENKNNKLCQAERSYRSGLVQDDEQQKKLLGTVVTRLEEEGGADVIVQGREVPVNDSPPSYTTMSSGEEEASAGTPVQVTSSGLAGNCRQVCNSYQTNPTADHDASQHEKPWPPITARSLPSTSETGNNPRNEPLNNATEMTRPRSLAINGGQRSLQVDVAIGDVSRQNAELTEAVDSTDEDSVSEETSLKS